MDYPFTSDGCTGNIIWLWKLIYQKEQPPWEQCCIEHDFAYWQGGTPGQRYDADRYLRQCTTGEGHPTFAWFVFIAVRFYGKAYWGWGWIIKRGYKERPPK